MLLTGAAQVLCLAIAIGYLHFRLGFFSLPAAVDPVPRTSCLTGVLDVNDLLRPQLKFKGQVSSVETVAVAHDGQIFAPDGLGVVFRAASLDAPLSEYAFSGGCPLGALLNSSGDLLIADAARGLVVVKRGTRRTVVLSARVSPGAGPEAGTPLIFADGLDIARDGAAYFTDATAIAPARLAGGGYDAMGAAVQSLLQASQAGRLLRFDPASGRTEMLATGLWFANGVALAPDESYMVVAETLRARLLRVWLQGPKAGTTEVFVDALPGLLDGVSQASNPPGSFWVAIVAVPPCKGLKSLASLAGSRLLRWALLRLPLPLPLGSPYGLVVKVDSSGRIIQALHDATGETARTITSAVEHGGKLYLGSLAPDLFGIPVLDLEALPALSP